MWTVPTELHDIPAPTALVAPGPASARPRGAARWRCALAAACAVLALEACVLPEPAGRKPAPRAAGARTPDAKGVAAPDAAQASSRGAEAVPRIAARATGRGDLRVAIEYPEADREVVGPDARGFVTGTAYLAQGERGAFEIYIALDASRSTRRPCGVDVDGDGTVGELSRLGRVPLVGRVFDASTDPGDNVLACEVRAAKTLLGQLDPETTQVAIIAFAGDRDPRTPDAELLAPLTRDYALLGARLDALLEAGPRGETNLLAAVQLATLEIERAYLRDRDAPVQRLVLLISDGVATLPSTTPPLDRSQTAIDAAAEAAEVSARFYTYAAGEPAPLYQSTLEKIAAVTGGVFENVSEPAELVVSFEDIDFAQIDAIDVRNVTTGQPASGVLIDPYGAFGALVGLAPGENVLEVFARSTTGAERREQVTVRYRADTTAEALPKRALERRGRLLEDKLIRLYANEIARTRARERRSAESRSVEIAPARTGNSPPSEAQE
jgi:hypothetical protein